MNNPTFSRFRLRTTIGSWIGAVVLTGLSVAPSAGQLLPFGNFIGVTPVTVRLDSAPVYFADVSAYEVLGQVMVPLRAVLEQAGATVYWTPNTQTVIATKGDRTLELTVDNPDATVNGSIVHLDTPAITISDRTVVPVQFLGEALNTIVDWDQTTQTVSLDTAQPKMTQTAEVSGPLDLEYPAPRPEIDSITDDLSADRILRIGDEVHVVVNGTPGGQAWFRVGSSMEDIKMDETSAGVYEGNWRNNTEQDMTVDYHDVAAHIMANDVSTPEVSRAEFAETSRPAIVETPKPEIWSITNDQFGDEGVLAGGEFHVVMHGTPGGQAWFGIRPLVADVKMDETSPGVYEGTWRNNTVQEMSIKDRDVVAHIVVNGISTPEVSSTDLAAANMTETGTSETNPAELNP